MPPHDETETYEYVLNDLRPYSRYRVRVRAENRLGTSVPSIPSGKCVWYNAKSAEMWQSVIVLHIRNTPVPH